MNLVACYHFPYTSSNMPINSPGISW